MESIPPHPQTPQHPAPEPTWAYPSPRSRPLNSRRRDSRLADLQTRWDGKDPPPPPPPPGSAPHPASPDPPPSPPARRPAIPSSPAPARLPRAGSSAVRGPPARPARPAAPSPGPPPLSRRGAPSRAQQQRGSPRAAQSRRGAAVPARPPVALGAAARRPLTCPARLGPDASPPRAHRLRAAGQTRVTTAPKAASLCSPGSREGPASPPSSLPLLGRPGRREAPPPPRSRQRSPQAPPVTHPDPHQSEDPRVASPSGVKKKGLAEYN
ncbi:proline-rich protein 2-like [Apodemus sylvaticus]|uniref:proline-rich protein 2-like n=1 Tax=Apodemus sylvaticus TaxID=10129 RepID=UPI002243BC26|nr:proline-rich protein 2-like [Apodemus sylvaticus]